MFLTNLFVFVGGKCNGSELHKFGDFAINEAKSQAAADSTVNKQGEVSLKSDVRNICLSTDLP